MKSAVIGHPIAHSKSPTIHQYWLDQHGLEGSYDAVDIAPAELSLKIQKMVSDGYTGFNVTLPHKQNIMALCDEIDETAQKIGAVNTVSIRDGKLLGTNTDAFGFIENIKMSYADFSFTGKSVFVLGAGGASRAVIYGLIQQGVKTIKLSNRTIEKAQDIQEMAPDIIQVVPWEQRSQSLDQVDILVNTTALGMVGKASLDINIESLPVDALVSDIVYTPLMTDLLKQAEARGNKVVTGIGMLLHQARPAFEQWTGILPAVTVELEQKILK